MVIQLRVAALVKAQFTTPPTGCAPYNAVFNNTSLAGQSFEWDLVMAALLLPLIQLIYIMWRYLYNKISG